MTELLRLRDLVYEKTGMYFPDEKSYWFEGRFSRRMKALGIPSYSEYLKRLSNGDSGRKEFVKLMDEMTINETSFFRNKPQFSAFERIILPEVLQSKQKDSVRRLKIWSAGCSSGEEVYTLAMIIDHYRDMDLEEWKIEIHGTDISERVLRLAERGVYNDYSVKNMPEEYLEKYITHTNEGYVVEDRLKKYIRFSYLNLNDDMNMVFMKDFDVVFCKNVLIYFDRESKKRVIQHFFNSLVMGGYLFIGFSESLFGVENRFKLIHYPGGMAYRKIVHI